MCEHLKRILHLGHNKIKIEAQFEITEYKTSKHSCYPYTGQEWLSFSKSISVRQANVEVKYLSLLKLAKGLPQGE